MDEWTVTKSSPLQNVVARSFLSFDISRYIVLSPLPNVKLPQAMCFISTLTDNIGRHRAETDMRIRIHAYVISHNIRIYIALFTLTLKLRKFRDLLMSSGIEFHNHGFFPLTTGYWQTDLK